jgi:hypothetical protein
VKQNNFTLVPSVGLYIDAHQLVLDRSAALDIFKGWLVFLMVASNVILTIGSPRLTTDCFASRVICNLASSQCFIGFMAAFGYSCYRQYLREWPDPPKDLNRVRLRVLRTIAFPIIGAWVCNFAWCFLSTPREDSTSMHVVFEAFTFLRVFGNGPNFLLNFSINLAVVYFLWRPITNLMQSMQPYAPSMDAWYPEFRQDVAAATCVLFPLVFTLIPVPDCTGRMRWAQWLFVCEKRDPDTPSLPALPHLTVFGVGVLVAAAWDRFISHLKPVSQGGPSGGLHVLPMSALRYWGLLIGACFMLLLLLFVPLGQVWLFTDLTEVQLHTRFGYLIRGYSGGPSMLWLLSTLWPLAVWAVAAGILVILRSSILGCVLHWPLSWLEHLGANVLFYQVVADLFMVAMSHGADIKFQASLMTCMISTTMVLIACRFFHFIAQVARK